VSDRPAPSIDLDQYSPEAIQRRRFTPAEIEPMCREQEREDLARLQEFADAIALGATSRLHDALNGLVGRDLWPVAAAIAGERAPSDALRAWFLDWWVGYGSQLRGEILDDDVLSELLRALLPPYTGHDRQLYRAEFAVNARLGVWGVSWTSSLRVARAFAKRPSRQVAGGNVVVASKVPAGAIIARLPRRLDQHRLREHLVDPRRLRSVRIVKRYAEVSPQSDLDDEPEC
jgi:hypothetical protein